MITKASLIRAATKNAKDEIRNATSQIYDLSDIFETIEQIEKEYKKELHNIETSNFPDEEED